MIEREDQRTVREKLGNAACACSDDVTGGELIKNMSITTNTVLFASVVRNQQRREKTSRNGVQEKKSQRERTERNQNKHLFYILGNKFLNADTILP